MKISLSVRIAESPKRKDVAAIPIEELAPQAAAMGFEGLSMRASVLSIDSPAERVGTVRRLLDASGLAVSMVTGDLPLAINNAEATAALRNIAPYLNLAEALDARLIRVMLHDESDIPLAQRAADEAVERGLALSHQTHWGSLFETADEALDVLARIDRPNFGVTYEPANLMACGGDYGPATIRRLAPHLLNVYFQNVRHDPNSAMTFNSRRHGPVGLRYVALDDPSGIDPRPLIEALNDVGYDGWFTVHQPLRDGQTVDAAMREAMHFFGPLLAAPTGFARSGKAQ